MPLLCFPVSAGVSAKHERSLSPPRRRVKVRSSPTRRPPSRVHSQALSRKALPAAQQENAPLTWVPSARWPENVPCVRSVTRTTVAVS